MAEKKAQGVKVGGVYKHYKGHYYRVLFIAKDSETLESVVVYQGFYESPEFGKDPIWVRPYTMFLEDKVIEGKVMPRFTYIGDKVPET